MHYLFHRYWLVNVNRQGDTLLATSQYMDTACEMAGIMRVGVTDFRVTGARVETYRVPEGAGLAGTTELDGLVGVTAYPGAGREVRRAVAHDPTGRWADLLLEGIKGLLQAEYAVYRERGFATEADYDAWFWRDFAGTCVYYSNPGQGLRELSDHIRDQVRGGCCFNRHRYCSITDSGEEYLVQAGLSDSFHEMGIALRVKSGSMEILHAGGHTLRALDTICQRGPERLALLPGIPLTTAARKELLAVAGGSTGCTHLADLVLEGVKTLELALSGGRKPEV